MGPECSSFIVSKDRLCEVLPADRYIYVQFRVSYHLSDWNVTEFEEIQYWLVNKRFRPMGGADSIDKVRIFTLLAIYEKATEWDVKWVKDSIVDVIKARRTCNHGFFSRKLVKSIYSVTDAQSGLRRYLVDSFVYKSVAPKSGNTDSLDLDSSSYWVTERRNILMKQMKDGNHQFVADCYEAFALQMKKKRLKFADPFHKADEEYHKKKKGKSS